MRSPAIDLEDRLYRVTEVAALIGCTRRTIERHIENRNISVTRLPSASGVRRMPRFTKKAILAFIASGYTAGLK